MSPRGGRKPGSLTPELRGKMQAGRVRAAREKRRREAGLASGLWNQHTQAQALVNISQGAYRSALHYVDDYEFVNGYHLDECQLRALREGVVYVSSVGCCHEHPFEDVTVNVLAAVERDARKHGRKRRTLSTPVLAKPVTVRKKPVAPEAVSRPGTPLTAVVEEMFSPAASGTPLLEVVATLFPE